MKLHILAFDHRSSLLKIFLREEIPGLKKIIYKGFKLAVGSGGVPKNEAAILVDEEFGSEILSDAKSRGFQICLPVEKSGVPDFEFEYGSKWKGHIDKFKPNFVKALIRNTNNLENLKKLSDFCHFEGYKFIIEIPSDNIPTTLIRKIHKNNIQPHLWKLKGFKELNSIRELIQTIQAEGRGDVGMLILGRGENQETVENWLRVGHKVEGVVGFAIGRTIFLKPLLEFKDGKIDTNEASALIAKRYQHFYNVFNT